MSDDQPDYREDPGLTTREQALRHIADLRQLLEPPSDMLAKGRVEEPEREAS